MKKKAWVLLLVTVLFLTTSTAIWSDLISVKAAGNQTFTVDMTDEQGELTHGASGFLWGLSNEDIPTTNMIAPLKPKVLATLAMNGSEHPYGDPIDVAKTFLESGGEQVQMYTNTYVAGPNNSGITIEDVVKMLKEEAVPAVVKFKQDWNDTHGTPDEPKDNIGARIDIDKALVYFPINEGHLAVGGWVNAWGAYYKAIKEVDPKARLGGTNDNSYQTHVRTEDWLRYGVENDCLPDVVSYHQLWLGEMTQLTNNADHFRSRWRSIVNGSLKYSDLPCPQIVANEYAERQDCGVPGRLVAWMSHIEMAGIDACLPFWHQGNNLNDLAAGANEAGAAWWLYKWYADMEGQRLGVSTTTSPTGFFGLASIDVEKSQATVLTGGLDGTGDVLLANLGNTELFKDNTKVNIEVQATFFTGYNSSKMEPEVVQKGTYSVQEDGSVKIRLDDMRFATAYKILVTKAKENENPDYPMVDSYVNYYEAEDAEYTDAQIFNFAEDGTMYYLSANNGIRMEQGATLTYTVDVPVDGRYQMDFVYANGNGSTRNNKDTHLPQNVMQSLSIDGNEAKEVYLISTLLPNMTGRYTEYVDLKAGKHTFKWKTDRNVTVLHDFVNVRYAGAFGSDIQTFDQIYEAEYADFNQFMTIKDGVPYVSESDVKIEDTLSGYNRTGYVTGLQKTVTEGNGVRFCTAVENSGLYNLTLRYQACEKGAVNYYIGNSTAVLDRLAATESVEDTEQEWLLVTSTIYLQKGMNVIDVDAAANGFALDFLRVQETGAKQSVTIEAESLVDSGSTLVCDSEGASRHKFVKGLEGKKHDADALEFTYEASSAGNYAMQIMHSNHEIAGTHSYNTKIYDKFAIIEVENSAGTNSSRYYFINTYSADTFKEKTVILNLESGSNIIRIYNDDSRDRYYGTNKLGKGENRIPNTTPNFDKFIITKQSSDMFQLEKQNKILVDTTRGGYAAADRNSVSDGETSEIMIVPYSRVERVMVDGQDRTGEAVKLKNGTYRLPIPDIHEDVQVNIYFEGASGEYSDRYIVNAGFGIGSTAGWMTDGTVGNTTEHIYDGWYLKLDAGNTARQAISGLTPGGYYLGVNCKGATDGAAATLSAGGESTSIISGQTYRETLLYVEIDSSGILEIEVAAEGTVYLDNFNISKVEKRDEQLVSKEYEYFVDAGDHNPVTLSGIDKFGKRSSVTDKIYGMDKVTGYRWGLVVTDIDQAITQPQGGRGIYSTYQWADQNNVRDDLDKRVSFRYARDQKESGINPRYIKYAFDLEPGQYYVEVMFGNSWNNSANPDLYVYSAADLNGSKTEDDKVNQENILIPGSGNTVISGTVTVKEGHNTLLVEANSKDSTIQMNYINISAIDDSVIYTELEGAYQTCIQLGNNEDLTYTEASWSAFIAVRDRVGQVLEEQGNYSQKQIGDLVKQLTEVYNKLEKQMGSRLIYFVDAGDHGPETLSDGDAFGKNNSVTDQIFGADPETGKNWGVYDWEDPDGTKLSELLIQPKDTGGVYTKYTWANENSVDNPVDGKDKTESFRYARDQQSTSIAECYVDYKFELEPNQEYEVEVGVGNHWGNASPVDVYANRQYDNVSGESIQTNVKVSSGEHKVITGKARADANGDLMINLRGTNAGVATINLNYIMIREPALEVSVEGLEIVTLPFKTSYLPNEAIDLNGLQVLASYSDQTKKFVPIKDLAADYDFSETGIAVVILSYRGVETDFDVTVEEKEIHLQEIKITKQPIKTVYAIGEHLDLNGMEVTAYYDDGSQRIIDDYEVGGFQSAKAGDCEITVSYSYCSTVLLLKIESTDVPDLPDTPDEPEPDVKVSEIRLNRNNVKLTKGQTLQLTATVLPANAADKRVIWITSNNKIASVDTNGKVTVKGVGKFKITAIAADGSNKSAVTDITAVYANTKKITLKRAGVAGNQKISKIYLVKGKKITLKGSISPENARQGVKYVVTKKNNKIISVDKKGVIKGRRTGKASFCVKSSDGKKKVTITVYVVNKVNAVKSLQTTKKTINLKVGNTYALNKKIRITPSNTTYGLSYNVNKKTVATVDKYGVVKAKRRGNAKITVKCGKKEVVVNIKVK